MENASKALIIAGSVLITLLIITLAVYVFTHASQVPKAREAKEEKLVIENFNSQFNTYVTEDPFAYTSFGSTIETVNFNSSNTEKRYSSSRELNTISDVVTAVNLAANVNYQTSKSYMYDTVETVNSVEIIIDFGRPNYIPGVITYRYYTIEPNKGVKENCVYGTNTISNDKNSNIRNFSTANPLSTYRLLEALRDSKLVQHALTKYTLYRYYFVGTYNQNKNTEKIDSVKFTITEDFGFDLISYNNN